MTQEQIIALEGKKHVKIYLLHAAGLTKKEVATAMSTNVGHVYNVLKKYESDERLRKHAEDLLK